ncbi:NAD(P)H-dependent oxidoreductase [Kordiimonas aquimaris]|uniref:NAD(P)H-dependent oxidoreductase n=1 Tax=Kordiimonas aquimaris TaxID=707591 RepID=UPI0021D06AFE|nr:NAD(P)H-dependent oxidoreductase [Kordiimonas aquimaris]
MLKRIVILQGHPDAKHQHLCHALEAAYQSGAESASLHVECFNIAQLDFPLLRSADDWNNGETPQTLIKVQKAILDSDHIVLFYPLWLGTMPAMLKAFLEQVLRPKMGNKHVSDFTLWRKLLKNTSARIVVTMGMPAFVYRWFYRSHSLKSLQRNILAFVGVSPVRTTLIGTVESMKPDRADKLFQKMKKLGRLGR